MAKKMAHGGKKASAKKAVDAKPKKVSVESKESKLNLDALRKPVQAAKAALDRAKSEAKATIEKADGLVMAAKKEYLKVLMPFRDACRRSGRDCEFEGARSGNVTEAVRFEIAKTDKGVRIRIHGRPKSEETIPFSAFKESSVSKLAYGYTDRQIGKRSEIGNKGGGLSNRLRALLSATKKG